MFFACTTKSVFACTTEAPSDDDDDDDDGDDGDGDDGVVFAFAGGRYRREGILFLPNGMSTLNGSYGLRRPTSWSADP